MIVYAAVYMRNVSIDQLEQLEMLQIFLDEALKLGF